MCQKDTYAPWYPTGMVEDWKSGKLSHFPHASLSIKSTSNVLDLLDIDVVGLVGTEKHVCSCFVLFLFVSLGFEFLC